VTQYTVLWDEDLEAIFIDTWIASDSLTRAILTDVANWVDSTCLVGYFTKQFLRLQRGTAKTRLKDYFARLFTMEVTDTE
jgi:hypothetical protein